ncbi:MAG: type II secretion system protein [Patescibacteria group bacterium]
MMSYIRSLRGFSLVELLVVITILAIISTVAYTSFSGATDKAKNSKRISDLASIELALQSFRQDKGYVPLPALYNATTNLWGYNSTTTASIKNGITVTKSGEAITAVTTTASVGGGQVMDTLTSTNQIGAKGVIDPSVLPKEKLSQDLLDPALKDIKVGGSQTFADYGLGRYVYAVYAKSAAPASWNAGGMTATAFNLAGTILDDQKGPITKISGDFDDKFSGCNGNCPVSLIGPGGATANLKNNDTANTPFPINGF